MKTPTEIEEILTSKRVSWKSLLTENFIPVDLLMKYFDKIFIRSHGLIHTRVQQISDKYREQGEFFSLELHNKLVTDRDVYYLERIYADVIDGFAEEYDGFSLGDTQRTWQTASEIVRRWGHESRKILKTHLVKTHHDVAYSSLVCLAQNWISGTIKLSDDDISFIRSIVEEVDGVLGLPELPVIQMLYGLDGVFERFSIAELAENEYCCSFSFSPNNGYEKNTIFYNRLAQEMIDTGFVFDSSSKSRNHYEFFVEVIAPILDEQTRIAVLKSVSPRIYTLTGEDIDWDSIQEIIHELDRDELSVLFNRKNIPVEFLNKNASYVMLVSMKKSSAFPYRHHY